MHNLKLTLEYDGTGYAGWQRQNRQASGVRRQAPKTIQETLESTLQKILQEKIKLIGSGRTDAGVHAEAQVANFKTDSDITLEKLQKAMNALLPEDIVVSKIEKVNLGFHSRFDAQSKVYRYTILNRPYHSALLKDKVYFYPYPLKLGFMRNEAKILVGRHNFKAFQASDKKERDPIRTIKNLNIIRDKELIYVQIEANGFLYNMVRNIVGTLMEIGRGKLARGSLKAILLSRNRKFAGPTVPARGLCLLKVKY